MKQVSILGDEEENQPIDEAEQLTVEFLLLQLAGLETIAKILIGLVANEPGPQVFNSLLDTDSQLVEGATPICFRLFGPDFKPAGRRAVLCSTFQPGLVTYQPEETEVRKGFAFEDAFEVEFDMGLAREAGVVSKDKELEAIRDQGPQVLCRAVHEFLNHTVGT